MLPTVAVRERDFISMLAVGEHDVRPSGFEWMEGNGGKNIVERCPRKGDGGCLYFQFKFSFSGAYMLSEGFS